MELNQLSGAIIDASLPVHRALGPGLLESAYEECLTYELLRRGYLVERQKALPLIYETVKMEIGYRVDLWVEQQIIVEIKAVEALNDVHRAQLLTYLKLSGYQLGLLLNFNVALFKQGIQRLVYRL